MGQTQDNSSNKYFNRYVALLAMVEGQSLSISWRRLGLKSCRWDFMASSVTPLVILIRYSMRLPVRGIHQVLEWQKGFNQQAHRLRGKVVGHFSMTTTWGDPKEKTRFFESYYYSWPTNLLGPKPVEQIADLVQKSADGQIMGNGMQ